MGELAAATFDRRPFGRLDLCAGAFVAFCAAAVTIWSAADPFRFTSGDWPTQLLPWYTFLGERLRAGDIPGWNPHQFAGAPFAGDPNSGWAYLPSMILYALAPPAAATVAFIACQLLISGLATYFLARLLGLNLAGALIGALVFMVPWTLLAARQVPFFVSVTMWIPLALLGAERALRAPRPLGRLGAWVVCGLAVSQLLGSWLGKGAYYGVLPLGAWLAYRTLLVPAVPAPWPRRLVSLVTHGAVILLIGFGLGAAGVLPRVEATSRSNIAGGHYDRDVAIIQPQTAWSAEETLLRLAGARSQSRLLVGAGTFALAALALVVARGWFATPFFAVAAIAPFLLTSAERTPLHAVLFAVLPAFERIHMHNPAHIAMLVPLPAALLAGATVSALTGAEERGRTAATAGVVVAAVALARLAWAADGDHGLLPLLSIAAVGAVVAASAGLPRAWKPLIVPSLAVILAWQGVSELQQKELHADPDRWGTLYRAHGAETARFLNDNPVAEAITNAPGGPHRYNGYEPGLLPPPESTINPYRNAAEHPITGWLLLNNWATWFGLDTAQGYNPWRVERFIELVNAMNGGRQEYHGSNLFPAGLDSPLLDLLNVRFLIVPADAPWRDDLRDLAAALPTIYQDRHVRILENGEALPRAWLVHEVRQVEPGEALALLADGTVDPRQTALLEAPPPVLGVPPDGAPERATHTVSEPDRLVVEVETGAPALLVLSEVWDPGWSAAVDGDPAPVVLANHAFRAVAVPEGMHTVELRYDPPGMRLGLAITGVTALLLAAVWAGLRRRERETRAMPRGEVRTPVGMRRRRAAGSASPGRRW